MHHTRVRKVLVAAISMFLAVIPIASAATYTMTEVMNGLVTPRGLAFGPDGGLYVAEAGSGGSGASVVLGNGNTASLGATSSVSRLLGGVQTRVLSDLPSVATADGLDAGGLQDILFDGTGQAYGLFSFGSDSMQRDSNLGAAGAHLGTISQLPLNGIGSLVQIADIASHEFSAKVWPQVSPYSRSKCARCKAVSRSGRSGEFEAPSVDLGGQAHQA